MGSKVNEHPRGVESMQRANLVPRAFPWHRGGGGGGGRPQARAKALGTRLVASSFGAVAKGCAQDSSVPRPR